MSVELSDKSSATDSARSEQEEARIREAYARRERGSCSGLFSLFNQGNLFMLQERERRTLSILAQAGLSSLGEVRILDVGCGDGFWIRDLIRWGADPGSITGVDLLASRVANARCLNPVGVTLQCRNATALEVPDESFDLIIQSTVFTSILSEEVRRRLALEMLRVLKPTGLILWYDFFVNNPWNADVRGVSRHEIQCLFEGCTVELSRITLAPPISRLVAPYSWWACQLLSVIPFLCTHYLGAIRKPQHYEQSSSSISCS